MAASNSIRVRALTNFYAPVKITDDGGSEFRLVLASELVEIPIHVANEVINSRKAEEE